jgi:hypothetical protein
VSVAFVAVKSEIDVVARLVRPSTVNVPFEVIELVAVITPLVRVFMVPVTAEKIFVKKLVDEALVERLFTEVKLVIDVVARVVVPYTIKVPDADKLPLGSAVNFVFSDQLSPSQYNVELVAVPGLTAFVRVSQKVEVPFEARI